ncbi:MAG: Fur family transcriptional regulator [Georgenia sp.]
MIESEAATLLRGVSLRVTQPRLAVLAVLDEIPHADTGAVVEMVRERIGAVSTQAVYDVLKALVGAGLARRIDLPNSAARYERQSPDDHQHAVCRRCGSITDVDGPDVSLGAAAEGFAVDAVAVTYWGLCPACQQTHHEPNRPLAG